jgi:GNAT superfamily N-acetyltransferase
MGSAGRFEVRRATAADARVVGSMLFDFNTEFESPSPSADEFGARFETLLTRDDVLVVLAEQREAAGRGDAVGFAYLTLRPTPYGDGPLAQLEELYVVPELRDRGIGTDLLAGALAEVSRRGAIEMHINVDEVDVDTRRFYERHGFVNIEPGTDYRMLFYIRQL